MSAPEPAPEPAAAVEPAPEPAPGTDFDDSHLLPSSPTGETDWKTVINTDYAVTLEFITDSTGVPRVSTGYMFREGMLNGISYTGLHTVQRLAGVKDTVETGADGIPVHTINEQGQFLLLSDYHLIMRQRQTTPDLAGTDASTGGIQVRLVGTDYALRADEFRLVGMYVVMTPVEHISGHMVMTDTEFDATTTLGGAWSCLPSIISVWCWPVRVYYYSCRSVVVLC